MKVLIIAQNSFREAIRDRVLRVILGVSLLVIVCSSIIGEISLGEELKMILDLSLGAIDLFGVILCTFIGAALIQKEIEKKTIYTLLARPIHRWEFIFGKYIGMVLTLAVSVFIMGTVLCVFYILMGGTFNINMIGAVFMLFMGLALLNAISILFSCMASSTVSSIATIAVFLVGRSTHHLKSMAIVNDNPIFLKVTMFAYYLLPNFNNFNFKSNAFYSLSISGEMYLYSTVYALVYSFFVLLLASFIFEKRNF